MAAPATNSAIGIKFSIESCTPASSQNLLTVADDDAAVLIQILRSGVNAPTLISKLLTVGDATTAAILRLNGAAGTSRDLQWQTAGNERHIIRCYATFESGSNAGSNLQFLTRAEA